MCRGFFVYNRHPGAMRRDPETYQKEEPPHNIEEVLFLC